MKRIKEFDAHRYLRRTRHSHGWKVPTEPKRAWSEAVLLGAIVALAIVVASVVGQLIVEVAL